MEVIKIWKDGQKQIEEKGYTKPYDAGNREIITAVIVVDGEKPFYSS